MPWRAVLIVALAGLTGWGAFAISAAADTPDSSAKQRVLVVQNYRDEVIARVPLHDHRFAVSYRNSIYGTLAEERYRVLPDGRYRLVQIAADQLAVLEEYYAVSAPRRAPADDRRRWIAPPDPQRSPTFEALSIAATDLGQRTVHVPGEPPLALWKLVGREHPFVVLTIKKVEELHDKTRRHARRR